MRPAAIVAGVVLSLLCLLGAVGWYAVDQHKQVAALTTQVSELNDARMRDAKAAQTNQTARAAAAKKEKVQSDQLNKALSTEPVWASQPVPPAVCAALGLCAVPDQDATSTVPASN